MKAAPLGPADVCEPPLALKPLLLPPKFSADRAASGFKIFAANLCPATAGTPPLKGPAKTMRGCRPSPSPATALIQIMAC